MDLAILARHGESEYSAIGLCNGDTAVPVGLTERGREEARHLGRAIGDEPIELCITTEFLRTQETADIALDGRDVPRMLVPELNDPLVGPYEGCPVDDYRDWALGQPSSASPGSGGESRLAIAERYVTGFRKVLARPEQTVLVVCHSLPVAYALGAREGKEPGARMPFAEHATPYPFTREELEAVTDALEEWTTNPTW